MILLYLSTPDHPVLVFIIIFSFQYGPQDFPHFSFFFKVFNFSSLMVLKICVLNLWLLLLCRLQNWNHYISKYLESYLLMTFSSLFHTFKELQRWRMVGNNLIIKEDRCRSLHLGPFSVNLIVGGGRVSGLVVVSLGVTVVLDISDVTGAAIDVIVAFCCLDSARQQQLFLFYFHFSKIRKFIDMSTLFFAR